MRLSFSAIYALLGLATRRVIVDAPPSVPLPQQHPFRGALAPRPTNRLSGRAVATVLSTGLVATAIGVPFLLHRARWFEIESALAAWWLVWFVVLAVIAYRGVETADDYTFALDLPVVRRRRSDPPPTRLGKRSLFWDLLGAFGDLEGLAVALAVVAVLALAFVGAWMVLELLVPALFFVAYVALLAALRRTRHLRGRVFHAAGAAIVWATAYVGPLALTVWLVHVFANR
jgi:hypothetical protein